MILKISYQKENNCAEGTLPEPIKEYTYIDNVLECKTEIQKEHNYENLKYIQMMPNGELKTFGLGIDIMTRLFLLNDKGQTIEKIK